MEGWKGLGETGPAWPAAVAGTQHVAQPRALRAPAHCRPELLVSLMGKTCAWAGQSPATGPPMAPTCSLFPTHPQSPTPSSNQPGSTQRIRLGPESIPPAGPGAQGSPVTAGSLGRALGCAQGGVRGSQPPTQPSHMQKQQQVQNTKINALPTPLLPAPLPAETRPPQPPQPLRGLRSCTPSWCLRPHSRAGTRRGAAPAEQHCGDVRPQYWGPRPQHWGDASPRYWGPEPQYLGECEALVLGSRALASG